MRTMWLKDAVKDVDLYGGKLTGNQSTVISDTSSLLQYLLNFESIIPPFSKQLLTPKELKDFKLPIDSVLGIDIYEGIHINSGQPMYFSTGEIEK